MIIEVKTTEEALVKVYEMHDSDTEFVVGNDFGGFDLVESTEEVENRIIASFRVQVNSTNTLATGS